MPQFFYPDKSQIQANHSETARYLGYKLSTPPDSTITALIEQTAEEMHKVIMPKACYETFPLHLLGENDAQNITFADVTFTSRDLYHNLHDCTQVTLFAATIGPQIDALIRRTQAFDPVKASIMQATGAMYIEQFVDLLNKQIENEAASQGLLTRPRYSPGFGDVPLAIQKDFFRLLPCQKIGLTLMDTLIMAPEKSVTAFVGAYK